MAGGAGMADSVDSTPDSSYPYSTSATSIRSDF